VQNLQSAVSKSNFKLHMTILWSLPDR